jgi:hypothetical protein
MPARALQTVRLRRFTEVYRLHVVERRDGVVQDFDDQLAAHAVRAKEAANEDEIRHGG